MRVLLSLIVILWVTATHAQQAAYDLDLSKTTVDFIYTVEGNPIRGSLPLQSADMRIDVQDITKSQVSAVHDATAATGGFIFATQTLRGEQMLDAAQFPTVSFRSTKITGRIPKGKVEGILTIKGISRKVVLNAELFRQPGTDPSDLSQLAIELKGTINRHDFGLSGFKSFVDDMIELRTMAWINRR